MGRRLPKQPDFPHLPDEFVERMRRKGKQSMSLAELVEEFNEWQREKRSDVYEKGRSQETEGQTA